MANVNYLTKQQVDKLLKAAKDTRHSVRNRLIIMMLYRHGLRVSELCETRLVQLRLDQALFDVRRLKGSVDSSQPIPGDELKLMRRWLRVRDEYSGAGLPWLFISAQGKPLSRFTITSIIKNCAKAAGLSELKVSPHWLRHSCGFYLADKGVDIRTIQAYLGHANIQNSVRYTQLTGKQFENLW